MKHRVLVGIPIREIYGDVKPKTRVCLDLMGAHTRHATDLFLCRGQQITQNSYTIITKALSEGWDYLLYTGDDITFPPWALDRMIDHDVDIVGGVCTWKTPPYWVPAGMDDNGKLKNVMVTPDDVGAQRLREVDFVGSGFMLIKRKALQAVEEMYRDKVYQEIPKEFRWMCPVPYFPVTFDPDRNVLTGSDYAFCRAAKMAGQRVFLDCGVICGHRWEGEYDIRDHWRWVDAHGFAKMEPRFPDDQVVFEPIDKEKIYWGKEEEPTPITITSAGNEYHAIEHILPILKGFYAPLDQIRDHGKTKSAYIIGVHINEGASVNDYLTFAEKYERVLVHWVGSDIINIPKWMDDKTKAILNDDKFVHLVEDERLKDEVAQYFPEVRVLPIPTMKEYPVDPLPDNFTVAVYYPKHRHDFHYGDVLRGVIEAMPEVKFKLYHLYGDKPDFNYPNMAWLGRLENNEYPLQIARSSCMLRLSQHDGRPFSVVEFAIAGRRFVTNFDMPFTERVSDVPTVEGVVAALKKVREAKEPDLDISEYYKTANSHAMYRKLVRVLMAHDSPDYDYTRYWEERYSAGPRGAGGPTPLGKEADWVNEVIRDAVKGAKCSDVLDVGCGSMVRWDKLPVSPSKYTGMDISAAAVQMAHDKYPTGTFFVGNLAEDSIPQADAVIAIDVLPHIKPDDFDSAVQKMFRAAKKVVVVKTSLGVNDGHYQHAHNWNGSVPQGWKKQTVGKIPDNEVAEMWVFTKEAAHVDA